MNNEEVLRIISRGGVPETPFTCDQLTRLYTTMVAQLSNTVGHEQLLELLGFGGLLYSRAVEDFQTQARLPEERSGKAWVTHK